MEVDHSQTGSEQTGDGTGDTARSIMLVSSKGALDLAGFPVLRVNALVVGGRNLLECRGQRRDRSVSNAEIELPTSNAQRFQSLLTFQRIP